MLYVSRHQEHIKTFFWGGEGLGGPYIRSRDTKASGHEHLISKKIYVEQKKINNQFVIYMGHIVHFWIFGGPWGALASDPGVPKFWGRNTSSQRIYMYKDKK